MRYGIQEKPYIAILLSCVLMAFYDIILQFLHQATECGDELSQPMRGFVALETLLSLVNFIDVAMKTPFRENWEKDGFFGLWQAYNLFAYNSAQSSVLMSCIQIAVIQYGPSNSTLLAFCALRSLHVRIFV